MSWVRDIGLHCPCCNRRRLYHWEDKEMHDYDANYYCAACGEAFLLVYNQGFQLSDRQKEMLPK